MSQSNYRIVDSKEETIRGFIYHDSRLVCKTFPYSDEYTVEDVDTIKEKLSQGDWKFYPSYEGTILRIVNDGDVQLIATHKKLDAFSSRWGSEQSFGELFKQSINEFSKDEQGFERFLSTLKDKNHHTFLLCSNLDSRIVANRDNEVFYVGSFDSESHEYLGILNEVEEKISSFCKSISPLDNVDVTSLMDYVENKVEPFSQQGIIAIRQDEFNVFKILNSTYKHLSELRGNNPSLSSRYLELLVHRKDLVLDFCTVFSNKHHEFGYISELLGDLVHYLLNVIRARYIHKRFMQISPILHSFVKRFENAENIENITFESVYEKLKELEVNYIWNLMQSFLETTC